MPTPQVVLSLPSIAYNWFKMLLLGLSLAQESKIMLTSIFSSQHWQMVLVLFAGKLGFPLPKPLPPIKPM